MRSWWQPVAKERWQGRNAIRFLQLLTSIKFNEVSTNTRSSWLIWYQSWASYKNLSRLPELQLAWPQHYYNKETFLKLFAFCNVIRVSFNRIRVLKLPGRFLLVLLEFGMTPKLNKHHFFFLNERKWKYYENTLINSETKMKTYISQQSNWTIPKAASLSNRKIDQILT